MADLPHNKKLNSILPKSADVPSLKHDPLASPHTNGKRYSPCGTNSLSVGAFDIFAGNHDSWLRKAWKNACRAFPKQGFLCVGKIMEADLHAEESVSELKCSHERKFEVLPPFERHILLCMSQQSCLKDHVLLHADDRALHCKCARSSVPLVDCGDLADACSSSVGIFLQDYAKGGANLAHGLMDGKGARRRLHTLGFARLRGEPGGVCTNAYPQIDFDELMEPQLYTESHEPPLALLQRAFVKSFKQKVLRLVPKQQLEVPDKEMLDSVQDFFLYTEVEGRQVFEELDRDADGKLTIDDVKLVMKKMKLPTGYAKDFMQGRHQIWHPKSFGWSEFSSLMQEKEPVIIQLFNSLGVSKSGTINCTQVKHALKKAGLSATEANVSAMMKFLATDTGEYLKYSEFRRFMLLLPSEKLTSNPWSVWLKAATAGGTEPLSEDLQVSVFKYILSLPRTLQISSKQRGFEKEAIPC